MSHVATIDIEVTNLELLAEACRRIGLELKIDAKTYRWYGRHVGDYPLPEGFTAEDLGQCDHCIALVADTKQQLQRRNTYEIGVCRRRDGRPGYTLLWDFWEQGHGLTEIVGEQAGKLKQAYAITVAKHEALKKGFRVHEQQRADGSIELVCSR